MKKILVIGMADSVHLAKWLTQFASSSEYEFRLVSSSPHRKIHPLIRNLIREKSVSMGLLSRVLSLPLWVVDRLAGNAFRGLLLALYSSQFRPDLVHINEFQNAGYMYLVGRRFSKSLRSVKLLLTPYGSDIYWFQQFDRHLQKIKELLSHANAISAECRRDELLALKYGFNGVFTPRIPAFGSIELNLEKALTDSRDTIAIKGYQNHWGQALNALSVIEKMANELQGIRVELFSCNKVTLRRVKKLQDTTSIDITAHYKGSLSNAQVQEIMHRSFAMIALSKSDGISASMIEAMANGAVPIQSRTSCCDEWLEDGVGGFLVAYDDLTSIETKLRHVLQNPEFRLGAARANIESLTKKLDPARMKDVAQKTYAMALEH